MAVNYAKVPEQCLSYPSGAKFEVVFAGKIVSIAAPVVGAIAVLITIYDTCLGYNIVFFVMSAFMYLLACGLQACTFVLFAEPTFW